MSSSCTWRSNWKVSWFHFCQSVQPASRFHWTPGSGLALRPNYQCAG
jgi:hypothetical protein